VERFLRSAGAHAVFVQMDAVVVKVRIGAAIRLGSYAKTSSYANRAVGVVCYPSWEIRRSRFMVN